MSTRTMITCDQCKQEDDASIAFAAGWHSLNLHDFTTGRQRQVDLCGQCWTGARLTDLIGALP